MTDITHQHTANKRLFTKFNDIVVYNAYSQEVT